MGFTRKHADFGFIPSPILHDTKSGAADESRSVPRSIPSHHCGQIHLPFGVRDDLGLTRRYGETSGEVATNSTIWRLFAGFPLPDFSNPGIAAISEIVCPPRDGETGAGVGTSVNIASGPFIHTDRTKMAIPHSSQQSDAERQAELHPLGGETSKARKSGWMWILALIVLAGGGFYYYKSRPSSESKAAPAPGGKPASLGLVSVAVTPALKQNVPYYLSGLGTVTAFNTVTVKSRVDGELQKVNFTEWQFVREGDLLAQIDPRPFQVALGQMEGQRFRDQAQLANARVDFKR